MAFWRAWCKFLRMLLLAMPAPARRGAALLWFPAFIRPTVIAPGPLCRFYEVRPLIMNEDRSDPQARTPFVVVVVSGLHKTDFGSNGPILVPISRHHYLQLPDPETRGTTLFAQHFCCTASSPVHP